MKDLQELIKDVPQQPEILVGDEGAVEVARHSEVDAVITGQQVVDARHDVQGMMGYGSLAPWDCSERRRGGDITYKGKSRFHHSLTHCPTAHSRGLQSSNVNRIAM